MRFLRDSWPLLKVAPLRRLNVADLRCSVEIPCAPELFFNFDGFEVGPLLVKPIVVLVQVFSVEFGILVFLLFGPKAATP